REVSSAGTVHDDYAVGHVFAAVVAYAFNDCSRAGVTDRKALAGNAAEEGFAAGCAVQNDVADHNIFFGGKLRLFRRMHNDASAGETFTDVVIGVAFERHGHAFGEKCTKTLACRPFEL